QYESQGQVTKERRPWSGQDIPLSSEKSGIIVYIAPSVLDCFNCLVQGRRSFVACPWLSYCRAVGASDL
ncbi:MAG TPA: hypothetical protein VGC73_13655, partial [Pyrinomonadaceae bacterium]